MNNALDFVAGNPNSGALEMNPMDSDLASWVMMSGDLLGSSHLHSLPGGLGEEPLFGEEPFLGRDDPFMSEDLVVPNPLVEDPAEASIQKKQEQRTAGDNKKPTATTKTVRARKNKAPSPSKKTNASKAEAAGGSTAPSKRKFDRAVSNASVASGSASVGGDIADPTFKRQRRLEKNREIARNCRKRKREKYMKLEEEVVKLRQWNKQLEVQLNQGKDGRDKEVARKAEMDQMRKLIEKKCTETDMKARIGQYQEIYSDFGRERSAAIAFHMNKLKSLLIPTTVSKMTFFSLAQQQDFYDEKRQKEKFGGGIWSMLCNELQLTPAQKQQLLSMRFGIRQQRNNVAGCLRILKELDQRVKSNFESMAKQMDMVMSSISPVQQAKFLLWIERNQACSFMLNNMWNQSLSEEEAANNVTDEDLADSVSTNGMSDDGKGSVSTSNSGEDSYTTREVKKEANPAEDTPKVKPEIQQ